MTIQILDGAVLAIIENTNFKTEAILHNLLTK